MSKRALFAVGRRNVRVVRVFDDACAASFDPALSTAWRLVTSRNDAKDMYGLLNKDTINQADLLSDELGA